MIFIIKLGVIIQRYDKPRRCPFLPRIKNTFLPPPPKSSHSSSNLSPRRSTTSQTILPVPSHNYFKTNRIVKILSNLKSISYRCVLLQFTDKTTVSLWGISLWIARRNIKTVQSYNPSKTITWRSDDDVQRT